MSAKLQGKNVLVITANTGIERDELLEPLKTLKRQGATVTHATIGGGEAQTWVHDSEKDLIVNSDARLQCRHPAPGQRGPAPGQGIQRRRQDGRRHLPRPLAADRRRCRPRQDPDLLFQRAYRPDQRRRGLGRHAGESLPGARLGPDHLAQPG